MPASCKSRHWTFGIYICVYITGKSTWPTKSLLEPAKCHEQIIPVPFNMCPFHVETSEVDLFR